jgi:hypothetical protein
VRADEGAPGGHVAGAVVGKGGREIGRFGWPCLPLQRQGCGGEGRFRALLRVGRGGSKRSAVGGDGGTRLSHLAFQRRVPGGITDIVTQQAVALSHGLFIGQNIFGVVRQEAHCHAVEKAAAPVRALDPEPILRRHQPDDADQSRKGDLRGRFFVDADAAGRPRFGGKLHLLAEVRDRPGLRAPSSRWPRGGG